MTARRRDDGERRVGCGGWDRGGVRWAGREFGSDDKRGNMSARPSCGRRRYPWSDVIRTVVTQRRAGGRSAGCGVMTYCSRTDGRGDDVVSRRDAACDVRRACVCVEMSAARGADEYASGAQ